MLIQKSDRPLPRKLCIVGFIERASVRYKTVIRAIVPKHLDRNFSRLQSFLELVRLALRQRPVGGSLMDHNRHRQPGDVFVRDRPGMVRNDGIDLTRT